MRLGLVIPFIGLVCLLAGCKHADPLIGSWRAPQGVVFVVKPDHTFSEGEGPTAATGTWTSVDLNSTNKITFRIMAIGGKPPLEQLRAQASKKYENNPYMESEAQKQAFINAEIDKMLSNTYVLSRDAKTMSLEGYEVSITDTLTKIEKDDSN